MTNKDIIEKYIDFEGVDYKTELSCLNIDKTKPTLVFIDDHPSVIIMFKRLVKRMELENKYNIVYVDGIDASIKLLHWLYSNDLKIDYIVTDITFGGNIRIKDINYEINGIKLVGILKEMNNNIKYCFMTGHNIDTLGTPMFFKEYKEYADDNLLEHTMLKDTPISTNFNLIKKLTGVENEN